MRLAGLFVLPLVLLPVGCQHVSLRNHTERQARTLPDLQYDQVLANIAMFHDNPAALPFFSATLGGVTSNNYLVSPNSMLAWMLTSFNGGPPLFYFSGATASLGGQFTANEQWNTNSVLNPDELLLMRCVYQKVVGHPACDCDCEAKLQAYFAGHPCYLEAMRPGWYGVGRRHDVPECAAAVGHYHTTYAWVTADGVDYLTRVTLAILDLATAAAPFTVPDAQATRIAALTATAKDLSLILSQYPLRPSETPGPEYTALKRDLDETMKELSGLLGKGKGEEPAAAPVRGLYFPPRKQPFLSQPALGPTIQPVR